MGARARSQGQAHRGDRHWSECVPNGSRDRQGGRQRHRLPAHAALGIAAPGVPRLHFRRQALAAERGPLLRHVVPVLDVLDHGRRPAFDGTARSGLGRQSRRQRRTFRQRRQRPVARHADRQRRADGRRRPRTLRQVPARLSARRQADAGGQRTLVPGAEAGQRGVGDGPNRPHQRRWHRNRVGTTSGCRRDHLRHRLLRQPDTLPDEVVRQERRRTARALGRRPAGLPRHRHARLPETSSAATAPTPTSSSTAASCSSRSARCATS